MTILLFHRYGKEGSKGNDLFKITHHLRAEMKLDLGPHASILPMVPEKTGWRCTYGSKCLKFSTKTFGTFARTKCGVLI